MNREAKNWQRVMVFFCAIGLFCIGSQTIASELTPDKSNALYYTNVENVFDSTGQYKEQGSQIEVGDHFVGIINLQNIRVAGITTWWQSADDQITGIFALRVEAIVDPDTYSYNQSLPHLVLGAATVNSFCKGADCFSTVDILEPGEILALFHDYAGTSFESNGNMQDDVQKATDGELWLTLGYSSGQDKVYGTADDNGYYYSHVSFVAPLANFTGESWGGLNTIRNHTGYAFGGINDPNELEMGDVLIPGLLNSVHLSNEIEGNPDSVPLGGFSPWDIRSNDPAYMLPLLPAPCTLEVEKKCVVQPDPGESECETKIAAMLLRYTGLDQTGVNVKFKGKSGAVATYLNVNLTSGTELSGQNGFTIDAAESGKSDLGAKTTITIDGVKEDIHTSCSTPFVAGEPAPLDKPKGNPSPNWFVVSFRDKNGTVVPPPDPVPADLCTISEGGDDVEYTYTITNTGTEDVFDVTVEDDQLGTVPDSPILSLASDAEVTLTATQFVTENTTNVVTVTGKTARGETCVAMDSAEVIVVSLPFECTKPIDELTMIWNGAEEIHVKAWKGKPGNALLAEIFNIAVGDEITVSGYTGSPNDVIWEIFAAGTGDKIGESKFHLSCSDKDMNGPEDCGKPQGDGKKNESKYINDWLLEGMVDNISSFDCTP